MKKAKSILITLTMLLVIVLPLCLVGCSGTNNNTETVVTQNIVDMNGNTVTVPTRINSIICLGGASLRYITYAGQQNKLVGIEFRDDEKTNVENPRNKGMGIIKKPYFYANRHAFTSEKLPLVDNLDSSFNYEQIISLKPDVIFCTHNQAKIDELKSKTSNSIPVVALTPINNVIDEDGFNEFKQNFEIIGKVTNSVDRCNAVVGKVDAIRKDLDNRTKDVVKAEGVYAGAVSWNGGHGLDGTFSNFMPLTALNTPSISDQIEGNKNYLENKGYNIDISYLLDKNPKTIFIDGTNLSLIKRDWNDSYKTIDAIKNKNVYVMVSYVWYNVNIELALANAYYVGSVLYPEAFPELQTEEGMKAKFDNICEFFVGMPMYDVLKGQNEYNQSIPFFEKIDLVETINKL